MALIKNNVKRFFVLFIALLASFALVACGEKAPEEPSKIDEALQSINIGVDVTNLSSNVELISETLNHDLPISWEVICNDGTASLVENNGVYTLVITPTEYTEDASGNQTNDWGEAVLKATVTLEGKSSTRTWDLHIAPGVKQSTATTSAIKNDLSKDDTVELTGIVTLVILGQGFVVTDEVGSIYVYGSKSSEEVSVGDNVTVTATIAEYSGMRQLSSPSVVVNSSDNEVSYEGAEVATVADVLSLTTTDKNSFQKLYKLEGTVKEIQSGDYTNLFLVDSSGAETMFHYNALDDTSEAEVKDYLDKYVTLNAYTYGLYSNKMTIAYILGTIEEVTAPTLTDEDIVNNSIAELQEKYNNKSFAFDLDLVSEANAGASVTWLSGNQGIIANDGTFTMPTEDTTLVLTATVTSNDYSDEVQLTVTAKNLTKQTVQSALNNISEGDVDFVMLEGVIIGKDLDNYYYLADETSAIFVRAKLGDLQVGNKVRVIGKGTVYNNSNKQYTAQISGNYYAEKLDEDIHTSPLQAVDATLADFDFTINGDNLLTAAPAEEYYGKLVRLELFVTVQGKYNNIYMAETLEDGADSMIVYYKSVNQDLIKQAEGYKVKLIAVVADYHIYDGWRLSFLGREGDFVVNELTTEQKVAVAKAEIDEIVKEGDEVSDNLAVITETAKSVLIPGAKYTWTTDDLTTIDAEGAFNAPDADKAVQITVNLFLDGNTEGTASATWVINVTAKAPVTSNEPDLFISEYAEGSSYNKYIEIYNPTDSSVNLSGYKLVIFANGSAEVTATLDLTGDLAAGDVYVISREDASAEITAKADLIDASKQIINFNGDDALALVKGDTKIDYIGVPGERPADGWLVTDGATKDFTLVRKATVTSPNATWTPDEWTALAKDTWTELGQHTVE